jgi:hypothetical protein
MRDYVTDRVKSVPRQLDPAEVSAMANWVLFLTDSMPAAIDLVTETETAGLSLHGLFFHDLGEAQISRAPEGVAQLVRNLLMQTMADQFFGLHEIKRSYEQFKSEGVSEDILHQIAEEAMRLGIALEY